MAGSCDPTNYLLMHQVQYPDSQAWLMCHMRHRNTGRKNKCKMTLKHIMPSPYLHPAQCCPMCTQWRLGLRVYSTVRGPHTVPVDVSAYIHVVQAIEHNMMVQYKCSTAVLVQYNGVAPTC
jgi:hypothetical protein